MKLKIAVLIGMVSFFLNAEAQFSAVYPNSGSVRGYDVHKAQGAYFYTCGSKDEKIIYQINPVDGSIITSNASMSGFGYNGLSNGVGKNSSTGYDSSDGLGPFAHFDMGGTVYYPIPLPTGSGTSLLHQEVTWTPSNGFNYRQDWIYLNFDNTGYSPLQHWNKEFDTFSDLVGVDNPNSGLLSMYFTGTRNQNDPTTRKSTPFVSSWDKMRYLPVQGDYEEVPTKIVMDDQNNGFVAYGAQMWHGTSHLNHPVLRDAGIFGFGSNMWAWYSKTYHTSTMIPDQLGAAQSIILDPSWDGQGSDNLVFVASGNNPLDAGTNESGDWDKDYFHIVRTSKFNGQVQLSKRIWPLQADGSNFEEVQVSDLVRIEDGYLVVGTATVSANEEFERNSIFVMKLDEDFVVTQCKEIYLTNISIFLLDHLRANKIKIIDNDVFITGSYKSIANPQVNTPFLIKTTTAFDLECSNEIPFHVHEGNVYARERGDTPGPALLDFPLIKITTALYHGLVTNGPPNLGFSTVDGCDPNTDPIDDGVGVGFLKKDNGSTSDAVLSTSTNIGYQIHPNPSQNEISISGLSTDFVQITVVDMSGKLVKAFEGEGSNTHQMDISNLNNGVYILKINQNGQTQSLKLIKG